MKFELYLVRSGIISADQLVAALEIQHSKYVPIGQLAIEERLLSARDVFHVLHFQRRMLRPRKRFGEIAIEMGLISGDELQRLLFLQMDRKPALIEVLIRQGAMTPSQVDEHMIAFRRDLDQRNTVVKRRLPTLHVECGRVPSVPSNGAVHEETELFALMS